MKNTNLGQENVKKILQEIRNEITLVRIYLEFQTMDFVRDKLDKIASTPERKQVWILLDGTRTTSEIAEIVGVSPRSVQYFIKQLRESNLILDRERGYSQKRINLIPSEWEEIEKAVEDKKGGE
jgi:DNA-binding transcriptional ArsR family regulator